MNWHDFFTYDASTGNLIHRERPIEQFKSLRAQRAWNARYAKRIARNESKFRGAVHVRVNDKAYLAHRVIWEMHHGPLISKEHIDHIDGNPFDNRLSNLRKCTAAQNTKNRRMSKSNTSGLKGVHWDKSRSKWSAHIMTDRRHHFLGRFNSKEEAHAAYCLAARKQHGEFARLS